MIHIHLVGQYSKINSLYSHTLGKIKMLSGLIRIKSYKLVFYITLAESHFEHRDLSAIK